MYPPKRLFLSRHSIEQIESFLRENSIYKVNFACDVLGHHDPRTFTNWMTQATSIPLQNLQKICQAINIGLTDLTGEMFNASYLSKNDAARFKKHIKCHPKQDYKYIAESLQVDVAHVKNWICRNTSINQQQYEQLLKVFDLSPLPLKVSSTANALASHRLQASQNLRQLFANHPQLLKRDFKNISQDVIDLLAQYGGISEKNVCFFEHDSSHRRDFYALIRLYGQPKHCTMSFVQNGKITDYADITVNEEGGAIILNRFTQVFFCCQSSDEFLQIATWFGADSCTFMIRSADLFRIELDTQHSLTEEQLLQQEGILMSLR